MMRQHDELVYAALVYSMNKVAFAQSVQLEMVASAMAVS